jgi:hypothetical protein
MGHNPRAQTSHTDSPAKRYILVLKPAILILLQKDIYVASMAVLVGISLSGWSEKQFSH